MKKTLSLFLSLMMVLAVFIGASVTASAAEVTSVSFTPVKPIVFWDGYETNIHQISDSVLKNKVIEKGSVITYHYSDGSSIDYIYNGYEFRTADNSSSLSNSSVSIVKLYQYTWEIGEDNFIVLRVGNAQTYTVKVPITVIENPVANIEFIPEKPITYYENLGGQFTSGYSSYYNYYVSKSDIVFQKGNRLVVNYKDGTKSTFVYNSDGVSLIDIHGNKIFSEDIEIDSKQSEKHWTLGSDNYCEIKYRGNLTYAQVTVVESPVESISYTLSKPIELYENVDGVYDSYYKNFVYTYDSTTDAILTVNYKDGRTIPYYEKDVIVNDYADMLGARFFDEWGNLLPDTGYPTIISQNHGAKKWSKGTQYFNVTYKGATCDVPVTIVENPFSAMEVNLVDCCIYERTVEEHRPYLFILESHGNSITFTYKTGGTVTYTYDGSKLGWFDQYGNEFKHRISCKQYDDNWTTGQTYPITVSFGDLSDTVYVTMVSNPIVSVDVALSKPIVVYENVNCSWNEELSCLKYDLNDLLPDGTAIIFTYTNGTSKTYYYDKENRWLEDSNGVRIYDYTLYRFYLAQDNAFTLGDNYMFLEISQTSLRCAVPVTLKPQIEAPPYRLELVDGKWVCMLGDTKAGYYNGLIEHNGEWYYVYYGKVDGYYRGLYNYQGNFYYIKNGCVDWQYTDLVYYYGDFYYIENGVLNFNKTGLVYCWDEWYYVENGWFNPNATTLVYFGDQWYYVENGEINWNYTGLTYFCGDWYYIQNGWMNPNYTGLVEYEGSWYYVQNSWMNPNYTGLVEYEGSWYYVQNSWMNPDYTGLVEYEGSWYYVQNSWMNPYYTGIVEYEGSLFYVTNAWLNWGYNGIVEQDGEKYEVVNGVATLITMPQTKEEVLAFYQSAAQDIAENGSAGYNKKDWQSIDKMSFTGAGGNLLQPIIEGFMTKEENAEVQASEKGSDDAKNRMPISNCTADTVESATIETKGDNYLITIVMKEQVNPEKTDVDGIAVMSDNILYASDVIEIIETDDTINKVIKEVNNLTLDYKEYTIQAEMTKDGKLVNITQIGVMDVAADAKLVVGSTQVEGTITFNTVYSDFQY